MQSCTIVFMTRIHDFIFPHDIKYSSKISFLLQIKFYNWTIFYIFLVLLIYIHGWVFTLQSPKVENPAQSVRLTICLGLCSCYRGFSHISVFLHYCLNKHLLVKGSLQKKKYKKCGFFPHLLTSKLKNLFKVPLFHLQ